MIWDRWEDAMDDLRDERADLNREIEKLEERLRAMGVPVPPEGTNPEDSGDPGSSTSWADQAYSEGYNEVLSRQARLVRLRKLLERHGGSGGSAGETH
jgi:hypothetical protein